MESTISLIVLFLAWVPLMILLVSGIHHKDANVLWKKYGIAYVVIFLALWLYSAVTFPTIAALIGWGILGGIALTIALDIIRLTGVKLGTMPMDMPMNFGLRMTGLMNEVQKRMMMKRREMLASPKLSSEGGPEMKMPFQMNMFEAAKMMKPVVMEVLMENKAKGRVMFWGYIWHFLNGIAFGLTYVLVFGAGHWLLALGWALTVWILMMLVMPALMNGAQIPRATFFTALIAHIAMAVPLFVLQNVISIEQMQSTLVIAASRLLGLF